AFGIINTMLMAILERTREIGMLMALGMSKAKIFGLILNETLCLTLAGFPFGLFFSWAAIAYFNRIGINLSAFREELMKSFGFSQIIYPEFPSEQLTRVLLIVVSTALISGLFPAFKALSLKPVDALRK
ncbi:FtsX-like permease family protein, partial [bacterium]|nr:FtsX-like permease family protein [bacterium]